jgi:hypothetical protein
VEEVKRSFKVQVSRFKCAARCAVFLFHKTNKEEQVNFLVKLLRGVAFIPAVVHGIEALFGSKSGADKREAALSFVGAALSLTDAIANKDVVDADKFREGLGKIIDGTVECLNASAWGK